MATNQMRRDAAKRKLASQQARRAQQAARRRQIAVISSAAVVVLVLVGVVLLSTVGRGTNASGTATPTVSAAPAAPGDTQPAAAPGTCAYPPSGNPAKPNTGPQAAGVSNEGTQAVALATSVGPIGLTLNRAEAPCTVNSFESLVKQGYFDGTTCHRLTTSEGLKVLQCGDPTGTGSGGPGYTIQDEKPTGLAPAPAGGGTVIYPRGTLAMAKTAAPDSGGSQFFLVYADSTLPPDYTVFGTIDEPGLATIDKVAAAGTDDANGTGDGKPNTVVRIEQATLA